MASTFDDYVLALQLQDQFDADINDVYISDGINDGYTSRVDPAPRIQSSQGIPVSSETARRSHKSSLCDATWEVIDPSPDAWGLFIEFNKKFFWEKLTGVELRWSTRMTLCAGLCEYEGRGGLCCIKLSEPLLKFRPRKDLIETLLHEMIHAYLFVTNNDKDREGHGPEFLKHMHRLNAETGAKITVYHSFHDEVDVYRQHWWRCTGRCRDRQPYFGYVKRVMNRPPSARDPWFADHQQNCGGMFVKVKEPEGFGVKKAASSAKRKPAVSNASPLNTLNGWRLGDKKKATKNVSKVKFEAVGKPSNVDDDDFGCVDSMSDADLLSALSEVENNAQSESKSDWKERENFPGKGHTIGTCSSSPSVTTSAPPVRFLPGIGLVESRMSTKNRESFGQLPELNGFKKELKVNELNGIFKEKTLSSQSIELAAVGIVHTENGNTMKKLDSGAISNRDSSVLDSAGKSDQVSSGSKRKVTVSKFRTNVVGNGVPPRGSIVYVKALRSVSAPRLNQRLRNKDSFFGAGSSAGKTDVAVTGVKRPRDNAASIEDNGLKMMRGSDFESKVPNKQFQVFDIDSPELAKKVVSPRFDPDTVKKDLFPRVGSDTVKKDSFSGFSWNTVKKDVSPLGVLSIPADRLNVGAGVSGITSKVNKSPADRTKLSTTRLPADDFIRPFSTKKDVPSRSSFPVRNSSGSLFAGVPSNPANQVTVAAEISGARGGQTASIQDVLPGDSSLVECPACQLLIDVLLINQHLDGCLIY